VIEKSNTSYKYEENVPNLIFLFIPCPFCEDKFIFETGLLNHINNKHITSEKNIKKRVRHSEVINALYYYSLIIYIKYILFEKDLVITVASAVTELNCKRDATNSISLLYYIKSYGARTTDLNIFNDFIIENSGAIQFIVNAQTNVSNNF